MTDPTQRFSDRVDLYRKYRPGYPPEVLRLLEFRCGLTAGSRVADIGSGTGIFSRLLLDHGCEVFAVEPNDAMRAVAEAELGGYARFHSLAGRAEETGLPDGRVDLVVAAQAFHWFDSERARLEFRRILRPGGWAALLWNARRKGTTPFLQDYETLLLELGTDYRKVDHTRHDEFFFSEFFSRGYDRTTFYHEQGLDLEALKGRVFSSSYTPPPGHPDREEMDTELERLFLRHQQDGMVHIEYDTEVYFGQLDAPADSDQDKDSLTG